MSLGYLKRIIVNISKYWTPFRFGSIHQTKQSIDFIEADSSLNLNQSY